VNRYQNIRSKHLIKRISVLLISVLLVPFLSIPATADTRGVGDVSNAMIYGPSAPIGSIVPQLAGDDDSSYTIDAPFAINFFGTKYEGFCITTNGGVYPVATSSSGCSNEYDKDLENLALESSAPIIAALAADLNLGADVYVDPMTRYEGGSTTGAGDGFGIPTNIYQGTTTIDGRDAWVLTWYRVAFFELNGNDSPAITGSATFQIVLIQKDTVNGASAGYDFDIQFNYGTISIASDGYLSTDPTEECDPAGNLDLASGNYKTCRWGVGWSNFESGTADAYELFPTTATNDLIDSNSVSGLVFNNLNAPDVPGRFTFSMVDGETRGFEEPSMDGSSSGVSGIPWVGDQSISCPAPNPWIKEELGFAKNINPVLVSSENSVGKNITQGSYDSLKSSGVVFDTVSKKVSTATETLPIYGCKDKLLSGKVNQPIQFIAGGYTLQSDAHGYVNTADLIWHDLNEVTLTTNTAAFMHTIKFTKTGKYMVVLTEQPDTSAGISPTYGARSIRFVININ
jgi:hypothetical protein